MDGFSLAGSAAPIASGPRALAMRTNQRPSAVSQRRSAGGALRANGARVARDAREFKGGFGGGGGGGPARGRGQPLVKRPPRASRPGPALGGGEPLVQRRAGASANQAPLVQASAPVTAQQAPPAAAAPPPMTLPSGPPKRCIRAKTWSPEVENNFRLQNVGWRDISEYVGHVGAPPRSWPNGYWRCVVVKENGYFTYWSNERECLDKHVPRIKIFEY
eukprot:g2063.t1